ncbi:hypothetical protein ACFPPD_15370 [Cohnella suwonensis]|uniref:Uncharacterized protein n=1 Tax=Cohnella suwonensis TaxID=696072 RepID=A0ABW0LWH6_9BACL
MPANSKWTKATAKPFIGKPVVVELANGASYVGWVRRAEEGQLVLSGRRVSAPRLKRNASSKRRTGKAKVSAFVPGMMGSMLGGGLPAGAGGAADSGAAAAGSGRFGFGEFLGFMNKAMPMMKMGYGVIKSIMPLLQGMKF